VQLPQFMKYHVVKKKITERCNARQVRMTSRMDSPNWLKHPLTVYGFMVASHPAYFSVYTVTQYRRFRGEFLMMKRYTNIWLLYFTLHPPRLFGDPYFVTTFRGDLICRVKIIVTETFGSRPSDHYFRSVCWFVSLFVCLCRVFLSQS